MIVASKHQRVIITGGPECEHKPMASSSIMNQNEFLFVQDKEPPLVQARGKCKAMQTPIVNQRAEITRK